MAKKTASSQPQAPSTEAEHLVRSEESFELTPPETANRTSTSPTRPEEIPARTDERHYATHWGINE